MRNKQMSDEWILAADRVRIPIDEERYAMAYCGSRKNAAIVYAAPIMLAALKRIVILGEADNGDAMEVVIAKRAILKAEISL